MWKKTYTILVMKRISDLTKFAIFYYNQVCKKVVILYSDKISLSADDILEKDFKIDARGYRPQEVDKFLDLIISDYTEFSAIIKRQDKEIKTLMEENRKLKQEYNKLRNRVEAAADEGSTRNPVNNVDVLRRLSQLEKIVFGKDE